jgi:pilus assembly protein CpaB
MKRIFQSRVIRLSSLWALAIASGGLAMIAGQAYLEEQIKLERSKFEASSDRKVPVVVAKVELQRGDLIDASSMAIREVPSQYLSSSFVSPDRFETVSGARLGRSMRSGEPLLLEYLKIDDDSVGLSHRLKPGTRAVTINVDEVNALSGMLQPGDRVDLLISARGSETASRVGASRELTVPLMQDVLVLATGKQLGQTPETDLKGRMFTSITMELTPDQAQRLVTAQRGGRLTAMLRAQGDRVSYYARPIDIDQLLGVATAVAPAARAEPVRTELIVGGTGTLATNSVAGSSAPPPTDTRAKQDATDRMAGARSATGTEDRGRSTSASESVKSPILIR